MTTIKVALDWTPNPLHSGFQVALAKGYYKQAGLDVKLISPSEDNYATTPAKKLAAGDVDFCLCPSESVISFQTSSTPVAIKACAALLSRDASAIISRDAQSPKDLPASGTYASYGARYEDAIVQAMIDIDAGGPEKSRKLKTVTPAKLGIYETVLKGECDSTWVFDPYEGKLRAVYHTLVLTELIRLETGLQARMAGSAFHTFQLGDYGIPYGYSPLIAYNEDLSKGRETTYGDFLKATGAGYKYALQHSDEAASILREAMLAHKLHDRDTNIEFLEESQKAINAYYNTSGGKFGVMDVNVWQAFLDFLEQQNLLKSREGLDVSVKAEDLFTNSFLET